MRRTFIGVPIFPDFNSKSVEYNDGEKKINFVLECFLRKKHDEGKWYLIPFRKTAVYKKEDVKYVIALTVGEQTAKFIREIYRFMISGVICT